MAKVHQKIGTPPPPPLLKPKPTTTFLGCFRSSNKNNSNNNTKIGKSRRRWFSWSKKSAATKTVVVPLDVSTVSDKQGDHHRQPNNKTVKTTYSPERSSVDNKPKPKLGDDHQLETKLVVSAETDDREPPGVLPLTATVSDKNPSHPSDALKHDTRQQRRTSFCQRIESIRTGGSRSNSQPGSPVQHREHNKKKPVFISTASAATVVSPPYEAASTTTQPNPKRQKRGGGGGSSKIASSTRKTWFTSSERETTARLDPLVGMTIIMVTLIIMVIWGRLCAILCTAAWFYLLPRLTRNASNLTTTTFAGAGNAFPHPLDRQLILDFESDEYKKRVVLDGFLKRNKHHNHVL